MLLYLHLMPKKMDVANKPTQNTQEITVMTQHIPKCEIRTMTKVRESSCKGWGETMSG